MLESFSRLGDWLAPESQRNITHQWNYSPSCQELKISNPVHIISYFADKANHESMTINMDSKTKIEELHEDGVPVLLENYPFTLLNKFKVTSWISSSPPTLSKNINTLPRWTRTLIQNYRDETSGPSLLEILQNKYDIIIASDWSKSERKSGGAWIIVDSSGTASISGSNKIPPIRNICSPLSIPLPSRILSLLHTSLILSSQICLQQSRSRKQNETTNKGWAILRWIY